MSQRLLCCKVLLGYSKGNTSLISIQHCTFHNALKVAEYIDNGTSTLDAIPKLMEDTLPSMTIHSNIVGRFFRYTQNDLELPFLKSAWYIMHIFIHFSLISYTISDRWVCCCSGCILYTQRSCDTRETTYTYLFHAAFISWSFSLNKCHCDLCVCNIHV